MSLNEVGRYAVIKQVLWRTMEQSDAALLLGVQCDRSSACPGLCAIRAPLASSLGAAVCQVAPPPTYTAFSVTPASTAVSWSCKATAIASSPIMILKTLSPSSASAPRAS